MKGTRKIKLGENITFSFITEVVPVGKNVFDATFLLPTLPFLLCLAKVNLDLNYKKPINVNT